MACHCSTHPLALAVLLAATSAHANAEDNADPGMSTEGQGEKHEVRPGDAIPDARWEALRERQVTVTSTSGFSLTGAVVGITRREITLLLPNGERAVVQRSSVARVRKRFAESTKRPRSEPRAGLGSERGSKPLSAGTDGAVRRPESSTRETVAVGKERRKDILEKRDRLLAEASAIREANEPWNALSTGCTSVGAAVTLVGLAWFGWYTLSDHAFDVTAGSALVGLGIPVMATGFLGTYLFGSNLDGAVVREEQAASLQREADQPKR